MTDYRLELPNDYDDYAWQIESKGWFNEAFAVINQSRFRIVFYDPIRLAQDIDDAINESEIFFEQNLVVIKCVNKIYMEKAVFSIVESKKYLDMVKD